MLGVVRIQRRLATRLTLVFLMGLASPACMAVDINNGIFRCSGFTLNDMYSKYVVFDVVKHSGGLTTEVSAKGRLGENVVIERNSFQVRDFVISNPSYELDCYSIPEEGEVDINRWSNFYGFGLNRTSIEILHVYDEGDVAGEPSINFEVLDGQLWELYDGWIYKMKASEGALSRQ